MLKKDQSSTQSAIGEERTHRIGAQRLVILGGPPWTSKTSGNLSRTTITGILKSIMRQVQVAGMTPICSKLAMVAFLTPKKGPTLLYGL